MTRPASMTEQQYQVALGALAKARLEPFKYPRLAAIVQDDTARDLHEMSEDSQRLAGFRPGAKPSFGNTFVSSGRYHDLKNGERQLDKKILELLSDGRERTALETVDLVGASVDRTRRALGRLSEQGLIIREGASPARYRIKACEVAA